MILKHPVLTKPFNMDPVEYAAMFDEALPDAFNAVIVLTPVDYMLDTEEYDYAIWHDTYDQDETLSIVSKQLPDLEQRMKRWVAESGLRATIGVQVTKGDTGAVVWDYLTENQERWLMEYYEDSNMVDVAERWYVQVGFCRQSITVNEDYDDPVIRAIGSGMTHLDTCVDLADSVEPNLHKPVPYEPHQAKSFINSVTELYASRECFWNRQLVVLRNRMMIEMRAALSRKDPDDEYNRFVAANGRYFLEYPNLHP